MKFWITAISVAIVIVYLVFSFIGGFWFDFGVPTPDIGAWARTMYLVGVLVCTGMNEE